MSGIVGIIHFDGAPIVPGHIEKMTAAIAHRGPDGIHHWVKGSVALGHCLLRTTPESLEESQPLTNEDGSLVLAMDGRVDNWEELRRELRKHDVNLRDRSDAELVLRAYEIWGRDCLDHIDGDFALVIWDSWRQEAFCARDRMGEKPFNYHWNGRTLVFASELSAILTLPWIPQELNDGMVADYLAAEWHSRDETLWVGIQRLTAAHSLAVTRQGISRQRYWQPRLDTPLNYRNDEDYFEHYRMLFADSVRRLSRSHMPVACEVSGGLDSSAVFCMAAELRRKDQFPAPGLEGYTLKFQRNDPADELTYARAAGDHVGLPIHEVPPTLPPLDWYTDRARVTRDFPGFPNAVMNPGLVDIAKARGSRVMLNGVGGDEWWDGSRAYYTEEVSERRWRTLGQCYQDDARAYGQAQAAWWFLRHGLLANFPEPLKSLLRPIRSLGSVDDLGELYWLSPTLKEKLRRRRSQSSKRSVSHSITAGQRSLLNMLNHNAWRDLAIEETERLYGAQGVEVRSPLNTAAIVQCSVSMPERMRLRGNRSKFVHARALRGIVPESILDRRSKTDFSSVIIRPLDAMGDFFTAVPNAPSEWVDADGVTRLYRRFREDPMKSPTFWSLWGISGCDTVCDVWKTLQRTQAPDEHKLAIFEE